MMIQNRNIELLRVIGINLLIYYHVALISGPSDPFTKVFVGLGRAGWIGTDLFFVLAGYYCCSFFHKHSFKIGTYREYLINRAVRIVPSYSIFLVLYLSVGLQLQHSIGNEFNLTKGYILSFATFTANLKLATGPHSGVALEGLFSLSLGVQLFLIIGLLLVVIKKTRNILFMLILMELAAIVSRFVFKDNGHWFLYFFSTTRMDSFIFGTALCVSYRYKWIELWLKRNKGKLLLMSMVLFVVLSAFTKGMSLWLERTHQIAYPALAIILTMTVNFAIHSRSTKIIESLGRLGKYSYSIYLFKLPLIYFIFRLIEGRFDGVSPIQFSLLFLFLSIPANYIAGTAWYYAIERPSRRITTAFWKRVLGYRYL